MVMNCHKIWSDIKLVPSCISFHTYFIKFHIPLFLYSFCGSKTADTNELVFSSRKSIVVLLLQEFFKVACRAGRSRGEHEMK